jgi:hypothetical protein
MANEDSDPGIKIYLREVGLIQERASIRLH